MIYNVYLRRYKSLETKFNFFFHVAAKGLNLVELVEYARERIAFGKIGRPV